MSLLAPRVAPAALSTALVAGALVAVAPAAGAAPHDRSTAGTGVLAAAAEAAAPSEPTEVAASYEPEFRTVTVTWGPPASDGGSPVVGYQVSIDATLVASPAAEDTSVEVDASDLGPGTHQVAVCAENAAGCGAPATAEITVPEADLPPDTPRITAVKRPERGVLLVRWTRIEDASSYGVAFLRRRDGRVIQGFVDVLRPRATFDISVDLSKKSRLVTVYAINDAGESPLSRAVRFR